MKTQLQETMRELAERFASAKEQETSAAALQCWEEARVLLEGQRADGNLQLDHVSVCLGSLEFVVHCWATCGFETSFRLAGELLELAWGAADREAAASVSAAA
jgi:hypothetical protein